MVKGKTRDKKTKTITRRAASVKHKSKTTRKRTHKSKIVIPATRVIAAVWAHGGIIPINAPQNQATYAPPTDTNLNLVAFKPHGLCSWGSSNGRSKIDAGITELVTRDRGINNMRDFTMKLTELHNYGATHANSKEAKVTKIGKSGQSLYGLSIDYGKKKSKGNKFYTPMNGALIDAAYNDKVFVRLYTVQSNNDNIQIDFRSSAGDHTREVKSSCLPIASDIIFDKPMVRLDEIVKRISDEVRTFMPIRNVVVNLIDNNCNALPPGVPGKEIISSSSLSL